MSNFMRKGDVHGRAQIANFIAPDNGVRGKMERKGIKPRNHMADNARLIRDTEFRNREAKEIAGQEPKELYKLRQFREVQSRLHDATIATEQAAVRGTNESNNFLLKGKSNMVRENLMEENRMKRAQIEAELEAARAMVDVPLPQRRPSVPRAEEAMMNLPRNNNKDFIGENRVKAKEWGTRKPTSFDAGDDGKHEAFGRLPDYLVERKLKAASDEEERKRNAPDPDCPRGMKRMPEEERLNTLQVLKNSKDECLRLLAKLPFVIDTPVMKKKQETLELKLREIENAVDLFSKPKVFVAIDA